MNMPKFRTPSIFYNWNLLQHDVIAFVNEAINRKIRNIIGRIKGLYSKEKGWDPWTAVIFVKDIASPSNKLKRGPAVQPITASSPRPILEIARLAIRSPTEFPAARRVSPRKEGFMPLILPNRVRTSIKIFATNQIQIMLMMKL